VVQNLDVLPALILILVAARLAGILSRRAGMPMVLGELLTGLVLGPSLLNLVHVTAVIDTLANIGVLLLLFVAGLETDLHQMRAVGRASVLTAVGGVALPFAGGTAVGLAAGLNLAASLFLGTALTATSVSVSVQVLNELGRLRSRAGMVIMGAAVTDDVLGILVLSVVLAVEGHSGDLRLTLLRLILFIPVALLAGHFALRPLVAWIGRHHAREAGMALILAVVLLYAWSAEALGGLAAITGAYLAGVLFSQLPEAKEWINDGAATLGQGLFVPVFFVTVGLSADLHGVLSAPVLIGVLTAVAVVTKAAGAGLGARAAGSVWAEARVVAAGMIARGEVALVVAAIGLSNGLIDREMFTVVIVMTLVTTLLTPLLLKLSLRGAPAETPLAPAPGLAPVAMEIES
jgi:Kef-type K+ transport system membrane component KefB